MSNSDKKPYLAIDEWKLRLSAPPAKGYKKPMNLQVGIWQNSISIRVVHNIENLPNLSHSITASDWFSYLSSLRAALKRKPNNGVEVRELVIYDKPHYSSDKTELGVIIGGVDSEDNPYIELKFNKHNHPPLLFYFRTSLNTELKGTAPPTTLLRESALGWIELWISLLTVGLQEQAEYASASKRKYKESKMGSNQYKKDNSYSNTASNSRGGGGYNNYYDYNEDEDSNCM